jgi:predicted phage terminase large subunit-like protein
MADISLRSVLMAGMDSPWIPHKPHSRQMAFMMAGQPEVFFGGSAGGGKSDSLLMSALMFAEVPDYAAIIFRRTYPELSMPGGLLERSHEWLKKTSARWSSITKTWTFPSGATLSFGHMENDNDRFNYKSSEFQFIGFDELTSFTEPQYTYLFSRLRKNVDSFIPLRMRSASNPGDIGHEWVKKRFVAPAEPHPDRVFIRSSLKDNPTLNYDEYVKSLSHLDLITREQLLHGKWVDVRGNRFFPADWPRFMDIGDAYSLDLYKPRRIYLHNSITVIVGIDIALGKKKTSDLTSFVAAGLTSDGDLLILDVVDERMRFEDVAPRLNRFCEYYRPDIVVGEDDNISYMMQAEYRRHRNIPEVRCLPIASKAKIVRAQAAIIQGENKRIFLPVDEKAWYNDFCDKLAAFTGIQEEHDDVVDALGVLCRQVNNMRASVVDSEGPCVITDGKLEW